jgi:hypothetical protein
MALPRKLLVFSAVVGLALFTAAGLAWRYLHSPQHALQEIASAIAAHDRGAFERRVDMDALTRTTVDEVVSQVQTQALASADSAGGFAALGAMMGVGLLQNLKPTLASTMRSAVLHAVEQGSLDSALRAPAQDDGKPHFANFARGLGATATAATLGAVRRNGHIATAELRLRDGWADTTLALRLKLEERADGWQVVGFDNLRDYLTSLDQVHNAVLARENRRIAARMAQMVRLGPVTPHVHSTGMFSENLSVSVPVTNLGHVPLVLVQLRLRHNGRVVNEEQATLSTTESLAPGSSTDAFSGLIDYNPYIDWHGWLRYGGLEPEITLVGIGGEHPEDIRPYASWEQYVDEGEAQAHPPPAR